MKVLSEQSNLRSIFKWIGRFAVAAVFLAGYVWLTVSYTNQKICTSRYSFVWLSILYIALCIPAMLRTFKSNVSVITNKNVIAVCSVVMPLICFYVEEYIWNYTYLWRINYIYIIQNWALLLMIEMALVLILNRPTAVYLGMLWFSWFYGLVNYYVLQFKGNVPTPNDILAVGTAMNVASSYTFWLNSSIVKATMSCLAISDLLIFFTIKLLKTPNKKYRRICLSLGAADIIILAVFFCTCSFEDVLGISIRAWDPTWSIRGYGSYISFAAQLQNMKVHKPEGYSAQKAQEILAEYESGETNKIDLSSAPTVIAIMNESFSDLKVVGDFESDDYMPYFNSMNGYLMKGYVYASVCGGGTCNSEFEFLTGSSMANLNQGAYPYRTYNLSNCSNIVEAFSKLGYETIAIHPAAANNWNRAVVYRNFGFDEFFSLEDMSDVEYLSWTPSDIYDYKQIMQAYEEREKPVFIFNVTMQNHGGYYYPLDETKMSIVKTEEEYEDVINYLSLIKASDDAFKELIEYFSNQTEPVIICMFGDHQPELDSIFFDSIMTDSQRENAEQSRFITPYVIWSNYDTGIQPQEKDMSINYLGMNLMQLAGISTEYSNYLLDMQSYIPVINVVGYQTADGVWHSSDEENDKINEYKLLQYYEMFEQK
jgi:phosphoglycerol transferase MdoB-like AlkP superfamily enzyme